MAHEMIMADMGRSASDKERLRDIAQKFGIEVHYTDEADEKELSEARVLLIGFGAYSRLTEHLKGMKSLRVIQTLSAGVDRVPLGQIPEDIMVCSNAGAYSVPIAEHALAMILALSKRLKYNEQRMRTGIFDQRSYNGLLQGRVLCVLGYGGIGSRTAELARCLGMKIFAVSRQKVENVDAWGTLAELDNMLHEIDVLLISIPLNKHTTSLIDSRRLKLMKDTAILVNVARGEIVVEEDLYNHLIDVPTFSAGLDVWWDEPRGGKEFRPAHDFLALPNVIASPHNSGIVEGIEEMAASHALRNIAAYLSGGKPSGIVRREDYI
ncbi:MAG: 2-hydroxyacid dehydrogenase [Methanomassiliicoccales archaeon]